MVPHLTLQKSDFLTTFHDLFLTTTHPNSVGFNRQTTAQPITSLQRIFLQKTLMTESIYC